MSYSHIDGRLVGKPNQGPNKGKAFEFSSQTKVTFDPDTKYETMNGRRQRPIYTITKASKPKISIEFSSAKEKARWWKFMFGGGAPMCTISGNPVALAAATASFTGCIPSAPTVGFSARTLMPHTKGRLSLAVLMVLPTSINAMSDTSGINAKPMELMFNQALIAVSQVGATYFLNPRRVSSPALPASAIK